MQQLALAVCRVRFVSPTNLETLFLEMIKCPRWEGIEAVIWRLYLSVSLPLSIHPSNAEFARHPSQITLKDAAAATDAFVVSTAAPSLVQDWLEQTKHCFK